MIAVYIWIVALSLAIVILMIEDDNNKREMKILRDKINKLEDFEWEIKRIAGPFPLPTVVYDGNIGYINKNDGFTEAQYETLVEAERAAQKFLANNRK